MRFEYDPNQSISNKLKHGIDFEEAQFLWLDVHSYGFPAKSVGEERFALIATYKGDFWVAFYTSRKDRIRIISVRRARKKERELYEG